MSEPDTPSGRTARIQHLIFLAERGHLSLLERCLSLGTGPLCGNLEQNQADDSYHYLKSLLKGNQGLLQLLDLALLTRQPYGNRWFSDWAAQEIGLDLFHGIASAGELVRLEWRHFDFPLARSAGGQAVMCRMAGTFTRSLSLPLVPDSAAAILSKQTLNALKYAESSAREYSRDTNGHLCLFPLLPMDNTVRITGGSLGLPTALFCISLILGNTLHPLLTATGTITMNGRVMHSGFIPEKLQAARSGGYRLFLSPGCPARKTDRLFPGCVDVSSVDEAWLLANLFTGSNPDGISTVREMMMSSKALAANLVTVPDSLLVTAVNTGLLNRSMADLAGDPAAFKILSDFLVTGRAMVKPPAERTALCSVLPVRAITENSMFNDASVLKMINFCLKTANNTGNTQEAHDLCTIGLKRLHRSSTIPPDAIADFHNLRINTFHNRYQFGKDPAVYALAEKLERRYQVNTEIGYGVDPLFGRFCGTLAQNCGFRGSEHLAEFRLWHRLAATAFGNGNIPDYNLKQDYLRQYNHAVYALLDAGLWQEASEALCIYLETDDLGDFIRKGRQLTPWQNTCLARFLADTCDRNLCRSYLDRTGSGRNMKPDTNHPWQLWYYNTGRIHAEHGKMKTAEDCWTTSVRICMNPDLGMTAAPMALLGLSQLWKHDSRLGDRLIMEVQAAVYQTARHLNPVHFKPLLDQPDIQTFFSRNLFFREQLFPFTFR